MTINITMNLHRQNPYVMQIRVKQIKWEPDANLVRT